MNKKMNAIVLAGGFGSRLKPLTDATPKPMLTVANKPMLGYVIDSLKRAFITDVTFTLGYKGEIVRNYVTSRTDITAHFTTEDMPLGTAGAVKQAEEMLSDDFIVLSGDGLTDLNLDEMISAHKTSGALVTMATTTVSNPSLYGVVGCDERGVVTSFIEKPSTAIFGNVVNMGAYIINKKALELVPKNTFYDFSRDLFKTLLPSGSIVTYTHRGYWKDVGDKHSYYQANYDMLTDKTAIAQSSIITGTANNCIIGKNARVVSGVTLNNCIVLDETTVTNSYDNAIIGTDFVEIIAQSAQTSRINPVKTEKIAIYAH